MCLKEIKKIRLHKNYGWQVFNKTNEGNLLPLYMHRIYTRYGIFVRTNMWERDCKPSGVRVTSNPQKIDEMHYLPKQSFYISGFHIFLNKKDASQLVDNIGVKNLVIRKVYFRNILVTGYQRPDNKWPVVVAAERFVED